MIAVTPFWPSKTLWHVGWRYLTRTPIQTGLMILGIMLGVAVVVAIDLANVSASRAFDISTESISGRTTHQIVGGPEGVDEMIYVELRRAGITRNVAPVITSYVWSEQLGSQYIQLLGIDPIVDGPFRGYLRSTGAKERTQNNLGRLLTQPGAVWISQSLAQAVGIEIGDWITLDVGGKAKDVVITGLIPAGDGDNGTDSPLNNIMLADIATAQELTERYGKLSHIDLILIPENEAEIVNKISALLPESTRIQPAGTRAENIRQMTNAFQVNLTALSLLALLVGTFLIYNTMTFSVVRRRRLFGILRSIGVLKSEIFGLVLKESVLLGLIGSVLGIAFGILLSKGAIAIVSETINDLYFVSNVREIIVPISSVLKGLILGVAATLSAAVFPATEAANIPPRNALARSDLEIKAQKSRNFAAIAGGPVLALGLVGLSLPTESLLVGFLATLITVIGFALFTPLLLAFIMSAAKWVLKMIFGILGRLAPQTLIQSASRTSIAIAALMIAISVFIGMNLMVGSFRHSVNLWLSQSLQGDIYVFSPGVTANVPSTEIDPKALELVRTQPGIARSSELRTSLIDSPIGPISVDAINDIPYEEPDLYVDTQSTPLKIWESMNGGNVIVSESLAQRLKIKAPGDSITLYTDAGTMTFPVVAVYRDYSSSQGTLLMARDVYNQYWEDRRVTDISLWVEPGVDSREILNELTERTAPIQRLIIRLNERVRERALEIFDQAFAITNALQFLALLVAFVGIVSALLAMQLDRAREIGILRAIGLSIRQVWGLVMLETGLMGAMAGLLAMPVGYGLSLILIYIINKRAFGWSLQMDVTWVPFVSAFVVSVIAALLAGLYPAIRTSRITTAEVIRGE